MTTDAQRAAATERMALSRERKRLGLRCMRLNICDEDIPELVRLGLLAPDRIADHDAIAEALEVVLTDALA